MSDIAIRVEGLGKRYRLGGTGERYHTLRDQIGKWLSPRGWARALRRGDARPTFWALKDVSFDVRRGEVVGIIGRNGAGKSTLLKILSRITEPTEGWADIHGRVGSLLEVGTGFNPELTGRENIFLNGAILGMRRAEIVRKFDAIVGFAEVEKFLDTPVKHYSSGMYTRLAFAVAAHLEPEILVVDEVLAVGDAEFQKKCLGKMGEVARGGRTVLFVSHNMAAVQTLCGRVVVLDGGRIDFDGPPGRGVERYVSLGKIPGTSGRPAGTRPGSGEWRFVAADACRQIVPSTEPLECAFRVAPTRAGAGAAYLSGLLVNQQGAVITQFDSRLVGVWVGGDAPVSGRVRIAGLWLKPGTYTLDLYLCSSWGNLDVFERAVEFEILPTLPYPHPASPDATAAAVVLSDFSWVLDS